MHVEQRGGKLLNPSVNLCCCVPTISVEERECNVVRLALLMTETGFFVQ